MLDVVLTHAALRELLNETHVSGQRVDGDIATTRGTPFIVPKDLNSWMREEFKLMTMFIKCVTKCGLLNLEGKQLRQVLNECATLKNRHNCMAIGL